MSEEKLEVIVRAGNLMEYSIRVTSNRERYPAKYLQLIKRIQNISMDIYEFLLEANRTQLITSKAERLELQTRAITACDKLSRMIEMSLNLKLIDSDTLEHWQDQINDIKYMTIAWRDKDRRR